MKDLKPYILPEDNPVMANDAIAARMPVNADIKTLRHQLMDAISITNNQQALYTCLVFLNNLTQTDDDVKNKLLSRIEVLSQLQDGWDGEGSLKLDSEVLELSRDVIKSTSSDLLKDWVLFPDARGYLYWDYTQGKDIAGITIASGEVVAFVKKDGNLQKFVFHRANIDDVVFILKKTYE